MKNVFGVIAMLAHLKKEKVLVISLLLALLSMCFVPPDAGYASYVDVRVLALLFALMLLVRGLQNMGMFNWLIAKAFVRIKHLRRLAQMLILMCFFTSMIITNDVSLVTFVPFCLTALTLCGQQKWAVLIVVLQTIAANLGSMATPIGNPQNLYLFSTFSMGPGSFFSTVLPTAALSLVLLLLATLAIPAEPVRMNLTQDTWNPSRVELGTYIALFCVNLLVVFRVLHWLPALAATVVGVLLLRRAKLLAQVDYALLLTFVGFFVFVGNMGRIEAVSTWISSMLTGHEMVLSALFSQVLSNVPTAILLSGFTDNIRGLLLGVNIGGLGTLIASMASLISYKLYANQPGAEKGKYMLTFTAYNVAGFVLLLGVSLLCGWA